MPPRHAYWTIIFGNQPTAFRTATRDELLPTFKQIQSKHPDAVMMWFARGRLWKSEEEAREALLRRRQEHARRDSRGPRRDHPGPRGDQQGPRRDSPGPRREPGSGQMRDRPRPPIGDRKPPAGDNRRRGRDWRPGGQHQDPRDRFKVPRDVKRARFKARLRRDRLDPKPPRKKDDE